MDSRKRSFRSSNPPFIDADWGLSLPTTLVDCVSYADSPTLRRLAGGGGAKYLALRSRRPGDFATVG